MLPHIGEPAHGNLLTHELNLPAAEVVQEMHVWLDEHAEEAGVRNEVGVDEGEGEVFRDLCNGHDHTPQHARTTVGEDVTTCEIGLVKSQMDARMGWRMSIPSSQHYKVGTPPCMWSYWS